MNAFNDVPVEEWLCTLHDALREGPGSEVCGMRLSRAVSAVAWQEMGFDNGLHSHWPWCAEAEDWPFSMQECDGEKDYFPEAAKMLGLLEEFVKWYRAIKHFPANIQADTMPILARYLFLSGVRDRRGNPQRIALRPWELHKIIQIKSSIRESGRLYYKQISTLRETQCPADLEVAMDRDGLQLKNAQYHSLEIDMAAVRQNGLALAYVAKQTPELCYAAVQGNWQALEFVEDQSPEIVARACVDNPKAMTLVRNQSREVCEAAIRANPASTRYIRKENRLADLCILADDFQRGVLMGLEIVSMLRARKEGVCR